MYLLATPFTFLEIAAFSIAVAAFLLAVRFFIASQKKLEGLLPDRQSKSSSFGISIDRDGFLVPARREKRPPAEREPKPDPETKKEIKELRDMMQLQQLELNRALRQMESLNTGKATEAYKDDAFTEEEYGHDEQSGGDDFLIEELRSKIRQKDEELIALQQDSEVNHKLQAHFDDVQIAYEELQLKVQKMEQQAWQSAELLMKVDGLEQSVESLEKTVQKKEEKIRDLTLENARLHEALDNTEDKLSGANLQRQQLIKKVHFLEEMASDMQQVNDSNRKLKTEVRRVGELESMLDLITEERDALLKRKRV